MILQFADGKKFVIDDFQTKDTMIENVMRPGLSISISAENKKDLRNFEDMFDEDAPELRETLTVYYNEDDPKALAKTLANLDETLPGPAGHDKPYLGYTKIGSANYEKQKVPSPDGATTVPTEDPKYIWRLTVEVGQRTANE